MLIADMPTNTQCEGVPLLEAMQYSVPQQAYYYTLFFVYLFNGSPLTNLSD